MNITTMLILEGLLFLLILVLGFRLHKVGKPYPGILFNVHKLISLSEVALLVITVRRLTNTEALNSTIIALICLISFLIIAMIFTGGLLSIDKPFHKVIHLTHKIVPYISLASCIVLIYLILS